MVLLFIDWSFVTCLIIWIAGGVFLVAASIKIAIYCIKKYFTNKKKSSVTEKV